LAYLSSAWRFKVHAPQETTLPRIANTTLIDVSMKTNIDRTGSAFMIDKL